MRAIAAMAVMYRITPPKWKPCKARKKVESLFENLAVGSSKMHEQTGLSKLRPFPGGPV